MTGTARVTLGSLLGAALAAAAAPFTRSWFSVPSVGVGAITVNAYPKGWDYFVIALLVLGAFAGGALATSPLSPPRGERVAEGRVRGSWILAAIVFLLMLFLHDHPYAHMDPFHEGEHLTAGWLMKTGERPYGDFFIFHGLASDAALDALVLGDPPSPKRPRRLQTFLDAATIALLVPIAAELTATSAGLVAAVFASLCATAAFWIPVFPYYRLAPVLLAVLGMLRYARSGRASPLFLAFAASTLGVLWSLDTGLYALAGTALTVLVVQKPRMRVLVLAAIALLLPLLVLLAVRADIAQFFIDSFVIMPKAIDAVWALPAPAPFTSNGVRYFVPPIVYGLLLALALLAWRRGEKLLAAQIGIVAIFSILLFRTAAGRVSWSHTRFAVPLLGIAFVAFFLEPLVRRRRWVIAALVALPLVVYLEVIPNVAAGAKLFAGWRARQRHEGLVPYPVAPAKGIYTSPENAIELAALNGRVESLGPGPILDFSNERALYYLLQRKPPVRCMEISMLSVPRLLSEAMAQLEATPPVCVILGGYPSISTFDGVTNAQRVPELARWIDANYPNREQIGRFVVATR
ncbi:MAG TPA: hypothetical protein VNA69_01090 [Thermoanaerobaculia bacterium]|nr:hypothetical protein [Thermoanaerobaculia bacterium]